MFRDQFELSIELGHSDRRMTLRAAHHGDQETAIGESVELVRDGGERRVRGVNKRRRFRIGHVKEEDLPLALQNTEQPARSQHLPIGGEPYVMRFVARGAWVGKREVSDDISVIARMLVKIDHREKIRLDAGLVARPDEEMLFVTVIRVHNVE